MNSFELLRKIPVQFVADTMHIDSQDVVWASLDNGMICSLDPLSGVEVDHFGSRRFAAAFLSERMGYLISWDRELMNFDYRRPVLHRIARMDMALGPLCVDPETNACTFRSGSDLVTVDGEGNETHRNSLPFKPFSISQIDHETFCVSGSGVAIMNVVTGKTNLLEEDREIPVFSTSYDPNTGLLAAAGCTDLSIRVREGWEEIVYEDLEARYCQYSADGTLFVSRFSEQDGEPSLDYSEANEIRFCEISSGAFALAQSEKKLKLIVSGYRMLYFYG